MVCDGLVCCVSVCSTMLVSGWVVSLSELVCARSGLSNESIE